VARAAEEGAVAELWDACRPLQRFFAQRGGRDEAAADAFAFAHARLASDDPSQHALVGRLLAAEAWFRFLAGAMDLARAAATRALDLLRATDTGAVACATANADDTRTRASGPRSARSTPSPTSPSAEATSVSPSATWVRGCSARGATATRRS
jgi:hypothetical protein